MFQKITKFIPSLFSKARKALSKIPTPVKWLGLVYSLFVGGVMALYIGLFSYEFYIGKSAAKDLLPFLQILIGSSMISFLSFIFGLCIDSDGDGIPDAIDNKEGE